MLFKPNGLEAQQRKETGIDYCGIDLHQDKSEICIIDENGDLILQATIATTRKSLEAFFSGRPGMRVIMEAGGSSPWVSRVIEELEHEVFVCHPRKIRLIAESTIKNDRVDAEVLARLARIDIEFLGRVTHRSEEAQLLRSNLTARTALVKARTKWISTVRGILRAFGFKVGKGRAGTFHRRCAKLDIPDALRETIQPLLKQIESVTEEIEGLEERLERIAETMPEVDHLRQIPGVGLLVALYFVLTIDDPDRFRRSRDVAGFFGLRPSVRESADMKHYGRITKQGDPEMRRLLVQAAHTMIRSKKRSHLRDWALKLVERRGKGKATVALARKLAVLMHHLWVTGEVFRPFPENAKAA